MKRTERGRAVPPALAGVASAVAVAGLLASSMLAPRLASAAGSAPPAAATAPAKDAKPADPVARLLAEAWNYLELVNYPAAREDFERVEQDPKATPDQRAEALLGLGNLWLYRQPGQDVDAAEKLYRRVSEEFKDTPAGPLALLALARLADAPQYEKDRKVEAARELYRRIIQQYPRHFVAEEAVMRLATTYLENQGEPKSMEEGVRMLTEHLAAHPEGFLAPVMHLQLGTAYQVLGEYRKAVEQWIAADTTDARADKDRAMDRSARAGLYYRIARVAEAHLRDYDLAIHWYGRIVHEIKRDNKFYVSKLAIERCRKLAAQPAPATAPATREGRQP